MDYEEKQKYYNQLRVALDKHNELKLDEVLKSVEDGGKDKLLEFLKDNLIYYLDGEMVKKRKCIELKVLKITSKTTLETKIIDLRIFLEKALGELAYLRFKDNAGHIVAEVKKINDTKNFKDVDLTLNGNVFSISDMNTEDKKQFSIEHGAHLEGILRSRFGRKTNFDVDGLLSHKKGIYLGNRKFKSISDLKSIFSKLIKGVKQGEKIPQPEEQFLKDLMKYHEKGEDKLKDFDHFTVDLHPKYSDTKCFFVVKTDGSKEDFSYVKCIKEISKMVK